MYQAKNMGIDVEQLVLNSRHNNPKHIHPTRLPCESYATWSPKSEVAGCAVCTTELRPSSLVPCPVDLLFHSPHGQTTCGTDRAMDRYHAMVCQREGWFRMWTIGHPSRQCLHSELTCLLMKYFDPSVWRGCHYHDLENVNFFLKLISRPANRGILTPRAHSWSRFNQHLCSIRRWWLHKKICEQWALLLMWTALG